MARTVRLVILLFALLPPEAVGRNGNHLADYNPADQGALESLLMGKHSFALSPAITDKGQEIPSYIQVNGNLLSAGNYFRGWRFF